MGKVPNDPVLKLATALESCLSNMRDAIGEYTRATNPPGVQRATNPQEPTSDVSPEKLIVADALEKRLGYRPSPPTIWRWIHRGVRGAKLDAECCGQKWLTTIEDVEEFVRLQNADQSVQPAGDCAPERSEETIRRLKAVGLLK